MTDPEVLAAIPASNEAEQSVLGGLMLDNEAWPKIEGLLTASDFYRHEHRLVFCAIAGLLTAGRPADVITTFERLHAQGNADDAGGLAYLNALVQSVPSAANIKPYSAIVKDRAERRALIAGADKIATIARDAPDAAAARVGAQTLLDSLATSADRGHGLEIEWAHDLGQTDEVPDDLVQGVITRGAMSVLYGDSNSGKTFAAIHMAAAVANGIKWLGREVELGLVIYLATESPRSVKTRLRAYQRHFGVIVENLVIVKSPINLFNSAADTEAVVDLVKEIEASTGRKVVLIIGDTLARLSAGANENSGEDMGVVVAHVDYIRAETGAHFMLIHHCGKDQARGMRGWSGMRAATDTEIEVTEDEATSTHCMETTKQRDLSTKGDRIGFRLQSVMLGVGKWGSAITSCVVVGTDAPASATKGKRPSAIAGAINEFLTVRGTGIQKGALVKHFEGRYTRPAVYRELKRMREAGELLETAGIIAVSGLTLVRTA